MPAMHLFRSVLVTLANPKTFSRGLLMQWRHPSGTPAGDAAPPDSKAWRKAFEVAFVDSSGWLNLAASVSKAALAQARAAAARSLKMLSAGTPESFDAVFLARQRQAALCDYWYHVQLPEASSGGSDGANGAAANGAAANGSGGAAGELLRDQPAWR